MHGSGSIKWNKCYGGSNSESLFGISLFGNNYSRISIKLCADSGYVFSTGTASIDGDVIGHHGAAGSILIGTTSYTNYDFWVVKLDTLGTIKWQKTLGGDSYDNLRSIKLMDSGDFILGGDSWSNLSGEKAEGVIGITGYSGIESFIFCSKAFLQNPR